MGIFLDSRGVSKRSPSYLNGMLILACAHDRRSPAFVDPTMERTAVCPVGLPRDANVLVGQCSRNTPAEGPTMNRDAAPTGTGAKLKSGGRGGTPPTARFGTPSTALVRSAERMLRIGRELNAVIHSVRPAVFRDIGRTVHDGSEKDR